jgi:heat shock protein HslJ
LQLRDEDVNNAARIFAHDRLQSQPPMKAVTNTCLAVAWLTLASLTLAACSHRAPQEPELTAADLGPPPADLAGGPLKGTRWQLVSMGPADALKPVAADPRHPVFIEFDPVDQRLAGSTGCNRFFSQYRLIGQAGFTVGDAGITRMACAGPKAEQERQMVHDLNLMRFYGVSGQQLTIATSENQRLVFAPMAADVKASFRCDQGRIVNATTSAFTGHLSLQLPDGTLEDLAPESGTNGQSFANGLYRFQVVGENALLDDLTLLQQTKCIKQN